MWRKSSFGLLALGLLSASLLSAGNVNIYNLGTNPGGTYTGTFTEDDQYVVFNFTVLQYAPGGVVTPYPMWFYTNGYGGVPYLPEPNGFQPILTLFEAPTGSMVVDDPNSFLVNADLTGGTPAATANGCTSPLIYQDPSSGFCLDSYLDQPLLAGNYTLVLSEAYNTNTTGFLGDVTANGIDSFSQDGNGNFTGNGLLPGGCDTGSAFSLDTQDCRVRTGNYSVTITPEPSTLWLFAAGTLFIGFRFLNTRKKAQSQAK